MIGACQHKLTHEHIRHNRYCNWSPSTRHYHHRLQWYTAQRRLTPSELTIIEQLLTEIQHQAVYADFGIATLIELASPDAVALLTTRYEHWQRTIDARIAQAQADSDRLIQQLETLLPPPYPVGSPTGYSRDNQRHWTPDPSSQAEIDRVAALFTPSATIRRFDRIITLTGASDRLLDQHPFQRQPPTTPMPSA